MTDTAALRRLMDAATEGPWFRQATLLHGPDQGGMDIGPLFGWHDLADADAELIVRMRNELPGLLDTLDSLTAERRELRAALHRIANSDESDLGVYAKFCEDVARAALSEGGSK